MGGLRTLDDPAQADLDLEGLISGPVKLLHALVALLVKTRLRTDLGGATLVRLFFEV